jgi:hypothetical protein
MPSPKTVIVKAEEPDLKSRLARYGLSALIASARIGRIERMPGCLAIQHPRLNAMSVDEIYDLCSLSQIPLVKVQE